MDKVFAESLTAHASCPIRLLFSHIMFPDFSNSIDKYNILLLIKMVAKTMKKKPML